MTILMNNYTIHAKKQKMKKPNNDISKFVQYCKQNYMKLDQKKRVIVFTNSNVFYFDELYEFVDFYLFSKCFQDNVYNQNLLVFENYIIILYNCTNIYNSLITEIFGLKCTKYFSKKYFYPQTSNIRQMTKSKIVFNDQASNLIQIFENFQKSIYSKISFNSRKAISTNMVKTSENQTPVLHLIHKSDKKHIIKKSYYSKVKAYIKLDDQFDFNFKLKSHLLFICTIHNSKDNMEKKFIYQICDSTKKALIHFGLYELITPKAKRLTMKDLKELHKNASNTINQFFKEENSKFIEKICFENDEFKQLLSEVNLFVLQHSSLKSDLKQNWISTSTKFRRIKEKIPKDDESFQLIIQSFKNIKRYNHSNIKFNIDQKKSLAINLNSVLKAINIYFDFISNNQMKKQSLIIEKKLFNVIYHPLNDDSYRTNVFSVYQMHDNLINSTESFYSLTSSTGSGKTRCAPFFFAIKAIQENMIRPFFIMTQPRYSIIKTKIADFRTIFGNSIRIVTNINKMLSLYYKCGRKDIDFHPSFSKPIFGLFTAQSLLELMKEAEKIDVDIYRMTRFCLDEIHERTVETDVLCAILSSKTKEMINQNVNFPLQLLLMSATPDSRVFNCFDKIVNFKLPESQLFPIESIKHEINKESGVNSVIVNQTIQIIDQMANSKLEQGHILIFTSGNSRMKGIQRILIDKVERKCSSNQCLVKVIDDFDSLFEDEDIDQFYTKLDAFIEHETNKFNFFKSKGQSLLFILPIKYLGYVPKEQKDICINPIPNHPNVIKVIIATNAIESSITIDNLAAVIDSGLYNKLSFNRENGLSNLEEEQISIQNQIQRKGRVGRLRSGFSVKITFKNTKIPELLPPVIQISDVSLNILSLRKIGYKIEEIENLPDKIDESEKEKYISELTSFGALTDDTHELTSLGNILVKFNIISPFISSAILTVAGYKNEDYEVLNSNNFEDQELTEKELFVLLGCLISLIFSSGDIIINTYATKLREFFDKRSDIITLLRAILDLTRFTKKEIKLKEEEYGLNSRLVVKILGQLQQIAENLFLSKPKEERAKLSADQKETKKKEEDEKKQMFWDMILKSLRELLANLMADEFLLVFIEMLFEQIGKNRPEWIESRQVEFNDIENASTEPVFIFKGDKSLSFSPNDDCSYIGLLMRPGGIGLDCPPKGLILSISHDNNTKLNYGYLVHSSYSDEYCDFIPHPISIKTSNLFNNDFASPLLDAYFWEDAGHFIAFCSGIYRTNNDHNILFCKSNEVILDSDNQECSLISFIPKEEDAADLLKDAIEIIEHLLPYTPSTILIPNYELKCVVSLHGDGNERIDSSVHFFDEDEKFYPYQLTKETINYLHDNIEVLKLRNETMKIAITSDSFHYKLENTGDNEHGKPSTKKIENPHAIRQSQYVFNDKNSVKPFFLMTSTIKIDEFAEKSYLMPWLMPDEMKFISEKEQEMIHTANSIANETVTFKLSFYRLIFMTKDSIFQSKGRMPIFHDVENIPRGLGPLQKIFYLCGLNHIQGDSLTSPLEFNGFYFRGKPFPNIEGVYQIPGSQFRYLGNSVITLDVRDENDVDLVIDEMFRICNADENNSVPISVETIPVYSVNIKHSLNSSVSKEEFAKRVDSVINQFGGVIAWESKYIEIDSKLTGLQGMIKVLLYSVDFAIPLAGMIKRVLEEIEIDPFISILNSSINKILFNDRKVQETLNEWFIENDLQFDQENLQLIGDEDKVHHALIKFKENPPQIPFKSYPVPERLNILQINVYLNHLNRSQKSKWYLDKSARTIYAPSEVEETKVLEFLNNFENDIRKHKNIEDEDVLWELYLHDDDDDNLETSLSRQLITIFNDNGEIIQKNYCVECLYNSFIYNLRKMYNKEEDCCSIMEIYNDDKILQNISFIENNNNNNNNNNSAQSIPFGQMIWAFIKEPKITNITRTYVTALAIRGLKKSKRITFCPLHPYILLPLKCGIPANCSIPTCTFYHCMDCQQWHQIGKCEKEPSLPAGSRVCPFCNESVEKLTACNHIHCNCGRDFCYYCGLGFEDSHECYAHMDKEKHWEEAPDYMRFILRKPIKDKELKEFYEKYPKLKPKWMEDDYLSDDETYEN